MQLAEVKMTPQQKRERQDGTTSFNYDRMAASYQKGNKTIMPSTLARIAYVTLRNDDKIIGQLGNPIGLASYSHSIPQVKIYCRTISV